MENSRGKNIIIVEDEVAVSMALATLLERKGYFVRTAENGLDALELLSEQVPDLLVTDLKMPVMTGTDLIKRVRGSGEFGSMEILVITTSPDILEEENITGVRVLRKPIGFQEAVSVIEGYFLKHPVQG